MSSNKKYCCKVFDTGVEEGVFHWDGETWDIDSYDIVDDYPINFCPNCGTKVDFTDE